MSYFFSVHHSGASGRFLQSTHSSLAFFFISGVISIVEGVTCDVLGSGSVITRLYPLIVENCIPMAVAPRMRATATPAYVLCIQKEQARISFIAPEAHKWIIFKRNKMGEFSSTSGSIAYTAAQTTSTNGIVRHLMGCEFENCAASNAREDFLSAPKSSSANQSREGMPTRHTRQKLPYSPRRANSDQGELCSALIPPSTNAQSCLRSWMSFYRTMHQSDGPWLSSRHSDIMIIGLGLSRALFTSRQPEKRALFLFVVLSCWR